MLLIRRPRTEEGAAATALLLTAVTVGLVIVLYMALPYTAAVDAKAQNRTAADAAAIAGAEGALDDMLANLTGGPLDGDLIPGSWSELAGGACGGLGYAAATQYASLNDAHVVAYEFSCVDGTARVEVEGRGFDGEPARSGAVAELGQVPSCGSLPPPPTPSPTPSETPAASPSATSSPTPSPTPEPEPAEELALSVDCAGFDLHLQLRDTDGDGVHDSFHLPPGQLDTIADTVDVRLID